MSLTVTADTSVAEVRLTTIDAAIRARLKTAVEALEQELLGAAEARAPVRTGAYRASIAGGVGVTETSVAGVVGSHSPIAGIVEAGAHIGPHDIVPDVKRALKFLGGGAGAVFAAHVHSPGATLVGKDVIHGAFDAMQQEILDTLRAAAADAARTN